MRQNLKSKKAITPVVATALLLVVVVVAVVGFQTWFGGYSSGMFSKVETQSNQATGNSLSVETVVGNTLYVKNGIANNLTLSAIKIGDKDCNISTNLSLGINEINISSCMQNLSSNAQTITLITAKKIVDKSVYLKNAQVTSGTSTSANCAALDGIQLNNSQSAVFYNSSAGITCTGQTRTCNNGILNGTTSYNYSTCTVISSSLSCITDADGDGYISSSCAKYPMTNTTFEGQLDLNDSNSTLTISNHCWLQGNKSNCTSNFVINGCGTGTVLDMGTGLCWQQNMSASGMLNWTQAFTYCGGLTLGGHSDWYLPSNEELLTLTDTSRSSPAIVGGNNNIFTNVQNNFYWTASTFELSPSYAWFFNFNLGTDFNTGTKSNGSYVVCVRRD